MNRFILTGCIALGTAGALAASMTRVEAGPGAAGSGGFIVTSVTPAQNQSMLPDLSDPGANGRISVRFSSALDTSDVIDETNLVNGLSANCDFHDQTYATVPGSATVRRNVLLVDPFSAQRPVLPQGHYTLTLKSSLRSARGRRLNGGAADFTTTFNIGSDVYPPVLLRTSPAAGETGVGLHRSLVVTFDEPIDAASAAASVRLEDRSTVPPTPVGSRVRLARRGFDVVVTPDTRLGYPRGMNLTLVVAGRGSATDPSAHVLKDVGGNEFTRDASPLWAADSIVPALFHSPSGDFDDVSGQFTMTFRTK